MKYEYKMEKCRFFKKAQAILDAYAANGWRLVSMCIADMATQFILTFEREVNEA